MFTAGTNADCSFAQAEIDAEFRLECAEETKFISYPVARLYHTVQYNYWVVERFCAGMDKTVFPEKCFSTDGEKFILHHLLAGGNKLS